MAEDRFAELARLARTRDDVILRRFTDRFPDLLAAAELSVSMAGYNTSMDLLASGTFGLVWPFAQNREQRFRATRLARLGALRILEDEDLAPAAMARLMEQSLAASPPAHGLDLDGAAASRRFLDARYGGRRSSDASPGAVLP